MCPLRIILIFFSVAFAGYLAWKSARSPAIHPIDAAGDEGAGREGSSGEIRHRECDQGLYGHDEGQMRNGGGSREGEEVEDQRADRRSIRVCFLNLRPRFVISNAASVEMFFHKKSIVCYANISSATKSIHPSGIRWHADESYEHPINYFIRT
ncbi:unnamed protein product [Spirodela intermedia]|uniref:Uncharacterized protein n=1 Tax=Spirodela intermedia TaxID=51605 RepID=A0A7I8J2N1_SPIIN|nr:unnamed protein product [Spirodela intermedia]CAA6664232.1 unnamed protein product [Spirodela intermedia]